MLKLVAIFFFCSYIFFQPQDFTFSIYKKEDSTWAYKIYQGKKVKINQRKIPGITGDKGFLYHEDALKVAMIVIEKLNENIFPPTVTKEELKQLNLKQNLFNEGQ